MFQFIQQFSNWIFSQQKFKVILAQRPIRFGSSKESAHPCPKTHKANHARVVPSRKSHARPQMELLEARATPAHLAGIDIRIGTVDSPLVLQNTDWLAQPIHWGNENKFLTIGSLCPKIESTMASQNKSATPSPIEGAPLGTRPQTLDALLFANPKDSFQSGSDFTLSRDELFQTGEWGSETTRRDVFASWTQTQETHFITHGARTPDALLMASLAVVGVPLLSMSEKPEDHWEEVLPRATSRRKKGKPSLR